MECWVVQESFNALITRYVKSFEMMQLFLSEDCVLSFRTSGPTELKQMASGDARDLSVTSQQIGTQSLKFVQVRFRRK